jgi:hypothetical protein
MGVEREVLLEACWLGVGYGKHEAEGRERLCVAFFLDRFACSVLLGGCDGRSQSIA